eukprot:TRINITY_DN30389_c0_g1_i1.p1 TRINITY_DN30389_c0_g1~~TRINITY_DN30389_c0_g1_i1.p1  ORF type:complete len:477 (-),score=41.46 TRINITY_DN30389_c0_g1_i1:151-1581(-)
MFNARMFLGLLASASSKLWRVGSTGFCTVCFCCFSSRRRDTMSRSKRCGPSDALLGERRIRARGLRPLYASLFLHGTAYCIAMIPAFSLRFRELAAANGLDAAETAAGLGRIYAARRLAEFVATLVLGRLSDRIGRRPIMLLCSVALCLELAVLASLRSLWAFASTYVLFGFVCDSNGAIASTCIADATPSGKQRLVAFGRFFALVGVILSIGPLTGGYLANIDGRAPFAVGTLISVINLLYSSYQIPEYHLVKNNGKGKDARSSFWCILKGVTTSSSTAWYVGASMLASAGMGAVTGVQVLWLREVFGWQGRDVGMFLSCTGLLMTSQSVILPKLLRLLGNQESCVAQLGLLITAAKFVAFGLAPSGSWLYFAHVLGAAGNCSVAPLRSLCSAGVPKSQQGSLSAIVSGFSTIAQVLGSLFGSHVFAMSLRDGAPLGGTLFVGAIFHALAALCVVRGARVAASVRTTVSDMIDKV